MEETILDREKNSNYIIINADDFGITRGVNKAILDLADIGIITSTSVMTNMPYFKDVTFLKDKKIGIGIHFNLTVGRPVAEYRNISSIVDKKGYFYSLSQLLTRVREGKVVDEEVEFELEEQIKRLVDIGINPDHINSHESLIKYPFFARIMKILAQKYKIKGVRTYTPRKFDYYRLLNPRKILVSLYLEVQKFKWKKEGFYVTDRYDSLIEKELNLDLACKKLKDIFLNLPRGILELGIHPGYCNGDEGYLGNYVYEREIELKALLNSEIKKIVTDSKVKLISFKDLTELFIREDRNA